MVALTPPPPLNPSNPPQREGGGFELTRVYGTPRQHGTVKWWKKQGAVAPLSHRLDTSSRVERPKHDWGCESAAHVRQLDASGQGQVDSMRMNGGERKR